MEYPKFNKLKKGDCVKVKKEGCLKNTLEKVGIIVDINERVITIKFGNNIMKSHNPRACNTPPTLKKLTREETILYKL